MRRPQSKWTEYLVMSQFKLWPLAQTSKERKVTYGKGPADITARFQEAWTHTTWMPSGVCSIPKRGA
jgi:hypothetical protein